MRSFLIASLFVLSAAASAEDVGILLGLGSPGGTGSTVWISQQGVATITQRAGQGYWLWKDDGFWHVLDMVRDHFGRPATVTVTNPGGEKTVFSRTVLRGERHVVEYVAPAAIGLSAWRDQEVRSAASDLGANSIDMRVRRENFRWSDMTFILKVEEAFGEKTAVAFEKSAENAVAESDEHRFRIPSDYWMLKRDHGAWMLFGTMFPDMQSTDLPADFIVGKIDDERFGAHAGRRPTWSQIRRKYPDAIDYETSPGGTLTVIVTPTAVFVHKSNGRSVQKLLRKVTVTADRIVMTQWLEGDEVRKVAEAVAKIKS